MLNFANNENADNDSDHMMINNDNSISNYNSNVMIMTVMYWDDEDSNDMITWYWQFGMIITVITW